MQERILPKKSIAEGFKLIEWVLRILYNTTSKLFTETSAADKMKVVHILDFLLALFICKSTISSMIGHMLLFYIFPPSFIILASFHQWEGGLSGPATKQYSK